MELLREDPDLKPVFDDIAASGAAGMDKYWNDGDLMSKISRKMADLGVQPDAPPPPAKSLPVHQRSALLFCSFSCSRPENEGWLESSPSTRPGEAAAPDRHFSNSLVFEPPCQLPHFTRSVQMSSVAEIETGVLAEAQLLPPEVAFSWLRCPLTFQSAVVPDFAFILNLH